MVHVLQTLDVDKEHKVREINDCKCKFSFTWLDKEIKIKYIL